MFKKQINQFILWSENYTRLDTHYFVKSGFWLIINQVGSLFSSIVLGFTFANFISKETYGVYTFTISIYSLLSLFTLPGLETALVQAVSREEDRALFVAIRTRIRWGLLGSIIAGGLGIFYLYTNNIVLALSSFLIAVFVPVIQSIGSYDSFLQGKKLFNLSAKYSVISQIINIVSLSIALIYFKNVFVILLVYFLNNFLTNFFFLLQSKKFIKLKSHLDRSFLSYGKHLTLMSVFATVVSYADIPLIFHFLGSAQAAIYFVAITPPDQIKALFKIVANLALPKFSIRSVEEIKNHMARHIGLLLAITVIITFGYVIITPLAYHLLFPKYPEAVFFSQLMAISFISFPVYLITSAMQATRQTNKLYLINGIPSIIQLLLLIMFIIPFGILGALAARIVGRIFSFAFALYLYYRDE